MCAFLGLPSYLFPVFRLYFAKYFIDWDDLKLILPEIPRHIDGDFDHRIWMMKNLSLREIGERT